MQQLTIEFTTASPINVNKLSRQNRVVYQHLIAGFTITVFIAMKQYGILHLHSRISDLRNKHGVIIYDRTVTVKDFNNESITCKEYSIKPFNK